MQAARHLVGVVVKLAARVQDGEDDLEGRHVALLGMLLDRDAAAVVLDRDGIVGMDRYLDAAAVAGHGLVDRVVHDLPYQVMQAGRTRRADVHARTLANGLKTLENLDFLAAVVVCLLLRCHGAPLVMVRLSKGPDATGRQAKI